MTKEEIKERAEDKIWAKYFGLLNDSLNENPYWSIDEDRAKELIIARDKDIEIYSYILSLIEKDNKL